MDQRYKKIFSFSTEDRISKEIFQNVVNRIDRSIMKQSRFRATMHGILAVLAVVAIVPAFIYFGSEATQSGFLQYISLAVSDSSSIISDWKDLGLSILGSIPIISSVTCLAIIMIFTNSLHKGAMYFSSRMHKTKNIITYA